MWNERVASPSFLLPPHLSVPGSLADLFQEIFWISLPSLHLHLSLLSSRLVPFSLAMLSPSVALVASLVSLVAASPSLVSRNNGKNTNTFVREFGRSVWGSGSASAALTTSFFFFSASNYSVVTGFFQQTSPTFNSTGFNVLTSNFGLIDTSKNGWANFAK